MANAAAREPSVWTESVPNRSPVLIIVSIVFTVITTLFFLSRQAWRWAHRQRGWDDVMAALAYAVLVIQTIFGGVAAYYGFGKHLNQIKPTASVAMLYFYLYQICYKLLGGFTKLTFCLLYLRIFKKKSFHKLAVSVASIVAAGSVAFAIVTVFQCTPVRRAWDRTVPGYCVNNTAFWFSHAAFNTFFDLLIYVMPIPIIGSLKLARGQKTGLMSIFSLGAFVIAASIVRMVMLKSSAQSNDPTWGSMQALIWTEVEANTSVICCCLPALRVPFLNLWHRLRGGDRSPTPTIDGPVKPMYENAWTGLNQARAVASHGLSRPQTSHQSQNSRVIGGFSHGKSNHSNSTGGDTWYDRVLGSIGKEKDDVSRISSEDGLCRNGEGAPPRLQPGAIYKRTDVHVSMHDLRRDSDPEQGRQMSLQDMLNEH